MMFKRTITAFLESWKNKNQRKPLILRGARQVGKTTVVKHFGQQFDHFLYFNLELRQDRQLFEQDLPITSLIQSLFLYKKITRGSDENVLIFIDEIQYSGQAVAILRYFYEDHPNIHVIAAGSLLETLLDTHSAFPVGRVEYAYIYPVTFEEFLDASNESMLLELLQNEIPPYAHDKFLNLFHLYTMIGGMPEVVASFIQYQDWVKLTPIYDSLLLSYQEDVEKYAENTKQAILLRHVISHATFQAGNRITFQNFGQSNYGSREMAEAFRILEKAFLIKLIYPTTAVEPPFEPNQPLSRQNN
jgi:predicted AAA+ superfamily ATPase